MAGKEKWPEYLQSFPCLWNPQDPDFSNEAVKEACRERLLEICNVQSSVPIDMESLKQWLSANVVALEFQGVTRLVQPSQHNQTLVEGDVQQQSIMPDLKDLVLEYPCLWNSKDPNYKNYSMRERCKRQLLSKCNSLSPTVITMCTLRRELASLCSRMRRRKKVFRTAKEKRSLVASDNVRIGPVTAPAPPASSELQQIISPSGTTLPQIIGPPGSGVPQQIISPSGTTLPQIIGPPGSELPQRIISPLRSELPQQIISPPGRGLPHQIISLPGRGLPQQIISPLRSELPHQIISPPGTELPQLIISPLRSELPQQIIKPPGTELPQIISPPNSELPQLIIGPPGSGRPQHIISVTSGTTQRIPSLTEESVPITSQDDTPEISDVLPQFTPATEISPHVPITAERENDQNLPKEAEKILPKSKRKRPQSNGNKTQQLQKPTLSTLAEEFPCLWHLDHPHYGFGAVRNLSLQLLLVKYNDIYPEKLTLKQLRKKVKNRARTIYNNKTKNQAPTDQQRNVQNADEENSQPPSDNSALEISSDSDEPLSNYIHEEPQNQETTEITGPTTEVTNPTTEITVPDTETTVPDTETTVPDTETTVPDTETTVPDTEITVTDMEITMSITEIKPATETPLLETETEVPENDKNSLKENKKNKTKGQKSQSAPKKGEKETQQPTLATLIEEFPCLWDPEHPYYGFGAVKTLSLQLLLAKYNNVLPKKITLSQLKKKMLNIAKKKRAEKAMSSGTQNGMKRNVSRKKPARQTLNCVTQNSKKLEYPKDQGSKIQTRTEESSQPPLDTLAFFEISSDSSDSDEPLSNYKHRRPQNQEITAPNTEVTVPNTEITILNTEITVPNTGIIVPNTGFILPNMEITLPNTGITVPDTAVTVPDTGITVPDTGITVLNTGIIVANIGITVPNTGITVPNTGITVPNIGITVPDTGITVPNTRSTIPNTGITVPNTGITVPNTGITVPNTGITIPDTGITVPNTGITVPNTGITVPTTKITVPETGISVPNAVISFNWCRFCGELKNDCTNASQKNRIYLTKRTDCALHINDLWFYVGFSQETLQTICEDCDRKLMDIYAFVKHVKDVQATLKILETRLKRKSESVDNTESKDGSGGKKFKITIDFNSDKLPSLSRDEYDCVEINCNDKTDSLREIETDEVAEENCEVIDLSDDDIEMEPENEVRPLLSNDTELTNEVSESSRVSNDLSSQSQCVCETNDNVINCTVEANSLSVTDTGLANEVVKYDSKCVVPVNVISQLPCVNGNRWVEVSPMKKNDRDVNNEESERSEIGDSDSTQSCVDENDDDSLSATDTVVNDVDQPNESKVLVDISSNNIVSYKINGEDFMGICTDKGSHKNTFSVQTDLNSHSPLEDDAKGAVSKYRHLLLDSLSLNTEKNNLVSVDRESQLSSCNDDDLNILNNVVETKYKLLLDSHPLNSKYRKISEQNDKRLVSVGVKPHFTPSNNDDGRNNHIESKYRHLLLDSLSVSTESAKVTDEKNNCALSVDVKPDLTPSNKEVDKNDDSESKYRHLLLDSLAGSTESAKVTEEKNNCVASTDVKPDISPSCNTENGNYDVESKYKRLLLDSLSANAESAEVNEQKNQRVVSIQTSPSNKDNNGNNDVRSHENETDSDDTDSYEKFIKEVLLQAINSAGMSIRNSGESIKSIKCVETGTIVDVKKEVDDDIITDKEI